MGELVIPDDESDKTHDDPPQQEEDVKTLHAGLALVRTMEILEEAGSLASQRGSVKELLKVADMWLLLAEHLGVDPDATEEDNDKERNTKPVKLLGFHHFDADRAGEHVE